MALADIEARLTGEIPHKTCAVCFYMSERGEEWSARMRRMLANRGIKFKAIADELEADPEEPTIPPDTLSRHAQRGCAARESLR